MNSCESPNSCIDIQSEINSLISNGFIKITKKGKTYFIKLGQSIGIRTFQPYIKNPSDVSDYRSRNPHFKLGAYHSEVVEDAYELTKDGLLRRVIDQSELDSLNQ